MQKSALILAGSALLSLASPALAQLPEPVKAMIDEAVREGDAATVEAVFRIARATNPAAGSEIDGLYDDYQQRFQRLSAEEEKRRVEEIRTSRPFELWAGKGEFGAFRNTGDNDTIGVALGITAERKGIDWEHRIRARLDYQKDESRERDQLLLAYRPRWTIEGRQFVFGLAQYESDDFQGFDSRYSFSGGMGYRILDERGLKLSVEAGPAWRQTEFATGDSQEHFSGLGTLDFEWQLAEALRVTQDASAFVESNNSTFKSLTALEAGVSDGLIARLSYAVEYETEPRPGAVGTDTLSRLTFVYGF